MIIVKTANSPTYLKSNPMRHINRCRCHTGGRSCAPNSSTQKPRIQSEDNDKTQVVPRHHYKPLCHHRRWHTFWFFFKVLFIYLFYLFILYLTMKSKFTFANMFKQKYTFCTKIEIAAEAFQNKIRLYVFNF